MTPTPAQTYQVQPGDYLAGIAEKIYGDSTQWQVIYDANRGTIGSDPTQLQVGMVLVVPVVGKGTGTWVPAPSNSAPSEFSRDPQPYRLLTQDESNQVVWQVAYALMRDYGLTKEQAAGISATSPSRAPA